MKPWTERIVKLTPFLVIIMVSIPSFVSGAKFPNAIEKTFVIRGPAADSVARLLGLTHNVSLRLSKADAWAVYLLKKQDTAIEEFDYENAPPCYNKVEYISDKVSSLILYPYWLDLGTRLPEPKVGCYTFGSPLLTEKIKQDDPWMKILHRLKADPAWNGSKDVPFFRCYPSEKITLCIEVYKCKNCDEASESTSHIVTFSIQLSRDQIEQKE